MLFRSDGDGDLDGDGDNDQMDYVDVDMRDIEGPEHNPSTEQDDGTKMPVPSISGVPANTVVDTRRRTKSRTAHTVGDIGSNDPLPTRLRSLIRALNYQIIETARVESIFALRNRLPAVYMREYLDNQEHLSAYSLLCRVLISSLKVHHAPHITTEKLVVYTRTDSHLLRLVTDSTYVEKLFSFGSSDSRNAGSGSSSATATATATASDIRHYTATIVSSVSSAPGCSSLSVLCIIPLAAFSNSGECARTVRACMAPSGGRRMIIVVADMKQVLIILTQ